jgi:beta-galactosidase
MTSPTRALASKAFLFGGDYNPEQWTEDVWLEDIALMRQAGVNAATIGVFSWSMLEPEEGVYTFGWLDRIIELLHDGGIGVILATPTASPPPWFSLAHPDALPVDERGAQLWHGSRDTYCPSAPAYRNASRGIAGALAQRYAAHPAVIAWHVHNEYGTYCFCDHVAAAFRDWLHRRYRTLDALNAAWYTAFWSQGYRRWEEILPPRGTQYLHNPTQAVDFRRFMSDEFLACWREQAEVIRQAGSTVPITTNFMLPDWNHIEQWSWAAELDMVSIDHYLDTAGDDGETFAAYGADLTRSWAGRGPWLLMEQGAGIIPMYGDRFASKGPGRMLRNSLSYIARGSQGALFFQWRAPAAGAEVWHSGVVPHTGADSRIYREAAEIGRTLAAIGEVADPPETGPVVDADIAVLWHADGWWALDNKSLPSDELNYSAAVRATHRALWQAGYSVDFVSPGADLGGYRLVLMPSMFGLDDQAVHALHNFVVGGGHLAVWYFSGVADENLHVVPGGYPGRLRDLLGIRVEEFLPLATDDVVKLSGGMTGRQWSETVALTGASAVARYEGGLLAGRPAVTRNEVGNGRASYVSTQLDPESLRELLIGLADAAGVRPVLGFTPPPGVEVIRRNARSGRYLFVLNHGGTEVVVVGSGSDLLSGQSAATGLAVAGGGVAVIREDTRDDDAVWSIGARGSGG